MIKLNEILYKINQLEKEIFEISNILQLDFYTDGSGSIHSSDHEYFCFEEIKDLRVFMQMDFEYIIKNRKNIQYEKRESYFFYGKGLSLYKFKGITSN
jgi:hypothetical protein